MRLLSIGPDMVGMLKNPVDFLVGKDIWLVILVQVSYTCIINQKGRNIMPEQIQCEYPDGLYMMFLCPLMPVGLLLHELPHKFFGKPFLAVELHTHPVQFMQEPFFFSKLETHPVPFLHNAVKMCCQGAGECLNV